MKTRKQAEEMGVVEEGMECAGFHELLDWQIIQYRQTVNEYRVELSKEQHRCVSWQEAEQEFSKMGLSNMGEQWRIEYCGLVCPERNKCLLAMQLLSSLHAEPMHKAG